MNKRVKRIVTLLMAMAMMIASTITVLAATASDVSSAYSKLTAEDKALAESNLGGVGIVQGNYLALNDSQKSAYTKVSLGSTERYCTSSDIDTIYSYITTLSSYKTSTGGTPSNVQDGVSNMVQDFNVKADTTGATETLSGFRDAISLATGVILVIAITGLSLFMALDILWLTNPAFHSLTLDQVEQGQGSMVKTDKDGNVKIKFITKAAIYADQKATVESGASPLPIYARKKIVEVVAIAIVIYILFTGRVDIIANIGIKFVSGLINFLEKMF